MIKSNKINGKDLINVGIFSTIYLVIVFANSLLGYIPIFMALLSISVPLLCAVPFMLFLTRVKKFGMVWIMSLVIGLFMLLTGSGFWTIAICIVTGLAAELVLKSVNYKSSSKAVLTTAIFSLWGWGIYVPMYINRDAYFLNLAVNGYGEEYANKLQSIFPMWMLPTSLIVIFIIGLIGALIGKSLMKKHFKKAGII